MIKISKKLKASSSNSYNILQKDSGFKFTSRGALDVKGKGKIAMYFVDYEE